MKLLLLWISIQIRFNNNGDHDKIKMRNFRVKVKKKLRWPIKWFFLLASTTIYKEHRGGYTRCVFLFSAWRKMASMIHLTLVLRWVSVALHSGCIRFLEISEPIWKSTIQDHIPDNWTKCRFSSWLLSSSEPEKKIMSGRLIMFPTEWMVRLWWIPFGKIGNVKCLTYRMWIMRLRICWSNKLPHECEFRRSKTPIQP